jgi:alpha-ketoglutarate-dependent taurine dioxygenase
MFIILLREDAERSRTAHIVGGANWSDAMLNVRSLPGAFGMMVEGLDVRRFDSDALRELTQLLFSNRILVIAGQTLTHSEYVSFGRRWGEPITFINPKGTLPDYPEMIVQSNSASTPELLRNVAGHWHCDSSYEKVAATVTMLLGVLAPQSGGETLFADLVGAYESLSEPMKRRIEDLQVRHMPGRGRLADDESGLTIERMTAEIREQSSKFGPVTHPLVQRHPVSGHRALYALGGTAYEVLGMQAAEAGALLAQLKTQATASRFVQSYKLMPGDLLLWDNFSVMHRATPIAYSDQPGEKRLNYRISVKGLPDL